MLYVYGWPGAYVVCLPVGDGGSPLRWRSRDNDQLLLFIIRRWPSIEYDSVYRLKPYISRHRILMLLSSVTRKLRSDTAKHWKSPRISTSAVFVLKRKVLPNLKH